MPGNTGASAQKLTGSGERLGEALFRWLAFGIIAGGMGVRFYNQFFPPCFNTDEVALMDNVPVKGLERLLFPLDNMQSAPPLYLWVLKGLSLLPGEDWIAFKAFSLLVSCAILVYGYLLVRRATNYASVWALFLLPLAFNPYVVYHTMTVKPYGLDLLLVLMSAYHLRQLTAGWRGILFFGVWPFLSQAGLFYASGLAAITGVRVLRGLFLREGGTSLRSVILPRGMLLFTPLPYLLYYLWFIQQPGAMELKAYMLDFWESTFLALGPGWQERVEGVWRLVARDFFSSHARPATFLPWLALAGVLLSLRRGKNRPLAYPAAYLMAGAGVHLILNMLSLYPITDRFHLHAVPLVYLSLATSIALLPDLLRISGAGLLTAAMAFYFSTYLPYRENDVATLYANLHARGIDTVHCSAKAYGDIRDFDRLTGSRLTKGIKLRRYPEDDGVEYLVTREYHKFGHVEKTLREEPFTFDMEKRGEIVLIGKVDGYLLFRKAE